MSRQNCRQASRCRHVWIWASAIVAIFVSLPSPGTAQPTCTLPVTAHLTDRAGAPLDGAADIELRFYSDPAPEALPVECRTFDVTPVEDGWLRLFVDACSAPPPEDCGTGTLTALIGDAGGLWVEVWLGGESLGIRTAVGAVPFAVRAANADTVGGVGPAGFEPAGALDAHAGDGHGADSPRLIGASGVAMFSSNAGCVAFPDREVECWGVTDLLPRGHEWLQVVGSPVQHTCARDDLGSLYCGEGGSAEATTVEEVPVGAFTDIAVNTDGGACAVRTDGSLGCWGDRVSGAPSIGPFSDVEIGNDTGCAIRADTSELECWGYFADNVPVGPVMAVQIDRNACALLDGGGWVCWVGEGSVPSFGVRAGPYNQFDMSDAHACGVRADTTLDCWALDRLGADDYWARSNMPTGPGYIAVGIHNDSTACAVHSSGRLDCWGARPGRGPAPPQWVLD